MVLRAYFRLYTQGSFLVEFGGVPRIESRLASFKIDAVPAVFSPQGSKQFHNFSFKREKERENMDQIFGSTQ